MANNSIEVVIKAIDQASPVLDRIADQADEAFSNLDRGMRDATEASSSFGRTMRQAGESMVDFGENVMQGVTLPLALLGAAAYKGAADIQHMMAILQARTRGVGSEMQMLAPIAERVFRAGLGENVSEVANLVGEARMRFQELNATQLEQLVTSILSVSKALGVDASQSLATVRMLMDQYKISATQAMDLVAAGYTEADLSVDALTQGLSANATEQERARVAGEAIRQKLTEVKGAAQQVNSAIQESPWVRLESDWRKLLEAMKPIGDALIELTQSAFPKLISQVQQLSIWFANLSPSQQMMLIGFLALLAVAPIIVLTFGALAMIFGTVASAITWLLVPANALATIIGLVLVNAILLLITYWDQLIAGLAAGFNWVMTAAVSFAMFLGQIFLNLGTHIMAAGAFILSAFANVGNGIVAFGALILSILSAAFNRLVSLAIRFGAGIVNAIVSAFARIISAAISFGASVLSAIVRAFGALVRAVSSAISRVGSTIRSGWSRAVGFLRSINLFSIGRNIISGLINGISSMVGALYSKAASIASGIKNRISRALSIASPSKVTYELGQYVGEGLALGIESTSGQVDQASDDIASQAEPDVDEGAPKSNTTNRNDQYNIYIYEANRTTDRELLSALQRARWLYG